MIERLKKLVNNVRWKYFTNLQAGYTYQAVHNEIYQVHKIIEEGGIIFLNLENQTLKALQTTYIELKHQLEVETDLYIKSQIIDKLYLLLDEQKKILDKHKTAIDNYDSLEDTLE